MCRQGVSRDLCGIALTQCEKCYIIKAVIRIEERITEMAEWIVDKKDVKSTVDGDFFLYKNRPVVREDNVICYGSTDEKYYIQMIVMSEKEYLGKKVPDQIYISLISTADSKAVKEGMKSGLSDAMEIATIWLDRYLAA